MTQIILETLIKAPAEVCFDLIRDVRLHTHTTAIADGKVGLGQTVTFGGTLFGMRQLLKVKVIEYERPGLFVDEMIEGRFNSFKHIHEFVPLDGVTLMRDTVIWTSPFGILGRFADLLWVERHLRGLVGGRNAMLKQIAEESGVSAAVGPDSAHLGTRS